MSTKAKFSFDLAPQESINYLKNKGFKLSFDYKELMHEAHHHSFTVAKVMKEDLLLDIHSSLKEAMTNGETFKTWKKKIKPTLKSHGWYGQVEAKDPRTGEVKTIHVGSRRLKTIYNTNMRTAYNVGRAKQMGGLPLSKFWRYNSALLATTRDHHADKHGIIKHRDDPWWLTNYPPNDWNCKCFVTAHSKRSLEKNGWKETKSPIDDIASEDWDYDVKAGSKIGTLKKMNLDNSLTKLKKVSTIKTTEYKGMNDKKLLGIFFTALGAKKGDILTDKIGNILPTDASYFETFSGSSKITKKDRSLYVKEIAHTLKEPDEIILEIETPDGKRKKKSRALKKYFRYFKTIQGAKRAIMIVVVLEADKTVGVTAYFVEGSLEKRREGVLLYGERVQK